MKGLGDNATAAMLRAAADKLSALVRSKLYVGGDAGGFWACEQPDGRLVQVRSVPNFGTYREPDHLQRLESTCIFGRVSCSTRGMLRVRLSLLPLFPALFPLTPAAAGNDHHHTPIR